MALITVDVNVDGNGNVRVTPSQDRTFVKDEDSVTFKSNRKSTAIKFKTSPFKEIRTGGLLKDLQSRRGPFKVIKTGKFHFDCGHIVERAFARWSLTGFDIPVC